MRGGIRIFAIGIAAFLINGIASAQAPQGGTYVCRDKRTQIFVVAPCFGDPLRCQTRWFVDGEEKPGVILRLPQLDQELTTCLGPNAAKVPARSETPEPRRAPPAASAGAPRAQRQTDVLPPTTDPGTLAARNCVASGRSLMDCVGAAFNTTLAGTPLGKAPPPPGVRLNGVYRNANDLQATFLPWPATEAVMEWNCGLEPDTRRYSVDITAGRPLVRIDVGSEILTFTVTANGALSGPPSAVINGQMRTGTRTETRTFADGRVERSAVPVLAPKTARCPIGTLSATGEVAPPEPSPNIPATYVAEVLGLNQAAQQAAQTQAFKPVAGWRLLGTYQDGTGSSVEFRADSATVSCGNVLLAQRYAVELRNDQLVATLQNTPAPIVLTLQRNGTLTGPRTAQVSGRVLTGMSGSQVIYAPAAATCKLDLLRP